MRSTCCGPDLCVGLNASLCGRQRNVGALSAGTSLGAAAGKSGGNTRRGRTATVEGHLGTGRSTASPRRQVHPLALTKLLLAELLYSICVGPCGLLCRELAWSACCRGLMQCRHGCSFVA